MTELHCPRKYGMFHSSPRLLPLLMWVLLMVLPGPGILGSQAQTRISGAVLDADTREPLPAVTIRFMHSLGGTNSRHDGSFSLPILPHQHQDTLLFSCIGYADLTIAVATLRLAQPQRLYLRKKPAVLGSVAITAQKWVERKVGITSAKALVHFTDGTMPPGKPFEIAQLMRIGRQGAVLTSANVYLAADTPDSLTITLRFYSIEANRPGRPLVPQPIRQRVATRQGWLHLDLASSGVYLTQDFVLGLEIWPPNGTRYAVPYEVKLGGSAKSFARATGEKEWRVPPHHYRLYVTARVPDNKKAGKGEEDENLETPATARLYSTAVQDSFSLFIRLPKGYARHSKRQYPVVFLLDANVYVEAVGNELERQHKPPVILVGVGYRNFLQMDSLRQRDYTYPAAAAADSLPLSGGGRQFLAFLERELLPLVDKTYRTDTTNRTLMGHSLGGYFTLYAMLEGMKTATTSFTRYVAASPSLYYGNQYLTQELNSLVPLSSRPRWLYLTIGSEEMRTGTAEGDANSMAWHAVIEALSTNRNSALTVDHCIYPGFSHMETAVSTFLDSQKQAPHRP